LIGASGHRQLLSYEGESLFSDIVSPGLNHQKGEQEWLAEFLTQQGDPNTYCVI
jgi:hypothetical protein